MDSKLQRFCDDYLTNRVEIEKVFKIENGAVYPVCANILLSHDQMADAEKLKECKKIISENTSVFNFFRGNMQAPAASLMTCSSDPEGKLSLALEYYNILKKYFSSSEELVLASLMLTDMTRSSEISEIAERSKVIYDLMKKKHRFITGYEDSVFAVLLSLSDRNSKDMVDDMEKCFTALKGMTDKNNMQTIAQIFTMAGKPIEGMCSRFNELFEAIRNAGMKYGKYNELPILAALSANDTEIEQIVSDMSDVSEYLKDKKGYKGIFGADKRIRLRHSAMLLNTYYSPSAEGDAVATASMLAIIAFETMLMMSVTVNCI